MEDQGEINITGSSQIVKESSKRKLERALTALREEVHEQQRVELEKRRVNNPQPTEEEERLGVFLEKIEPQVRSAVRELNRKGYSTYSSGFGGNKSQYQVMEGTYRLDEETAGKLREIGVEVTIKPSWKFKIDKALGKDTAHIPEDAQYNTDVMFKPDTADLQEITNKWDQIVSKFPDRGYQAVDWYRTKNTPE